jgi:hypothetical protein
MPSIELPIRAAKEMAIAHGISPDRCDILQNGSTLVLRLSDSLVARVVQDVNGPRQGTEWFARENAIALHLTQNGAPIIPLHSGLPPGPHEHLGYPMNFWQFVTSTNTPPLPSEIGRTLHQCHLLLSSFSSPLPKLAILTESLSILKTRDLFPKDTLERLVRQLTQAIDILHTAPHQPLHGDAHMGNLMQTTDGLLWTDWEDTFSGPIEWDLASIIWNAQILDEDHDTVDQILSAYTQTGGQINRDYLHQSLIARAVVMISWYPILYPNPNADRQAKLQRRLDWLKTQEPGVH